MRFSTENPPCQAKRSTARSTFTVLQSRQKFQISVLLHFRTGDCVTTEGCVSRAGHMTYRFRRNFDGRQCQSCNILLKAVVMSDDGITWSFSSGFAKKMNFSGNYRPWFENRKYKSVNHVVCFVQLMAVILWFYHKQTNKKMAIDYFPWPISF